MKYETQKTLEDKLQEERTRTEKRDKGDFPENWIPSEKGAKIEGKITAFQEGFGKAENLIFWILETNEGKEFSVLESAVLTNYRQKLELVVGDTVLISFEGVGKTSKGRPIKKFIVVKA